MRVGLFLYITKFYGGAERRLARIFNELGQEEVEVDLILYGEKDNISRFVSNELDQININIHNTNSKKEVFLRIFKSKYDWICHFDSNILLLLVLISALLARTKRLMVVAYYKYAYLDFPTKFEKYLFYFFGRTAQHIDCLYPSGELKLKNYLNHRNVSTTPCSFTNLDKFKPLSKKNLIVFASRLVKDKNPEILVDVAIRLKEFLRSNNFKIVICGDGNLFSALEKRITENNISDVVILNGFVDMSTILPHSKIFLSLQTIENYPSQSLLEAISCGNFIVATNKGDTSLIVKSNFGLLVELEVISISEGIIKGVSEVLSNGKRIINDSRSFAESNFLMKNSVDYFKEILNNDEH